MDLFEFHGDGSHRHRMNESWEYLRVKYFNLKKLFML
jgi:hypothetical protein